MWQFNTETKPTAIMGKYAKKKSEKNLYENS